MIVGFTGTRRGMTQAQKDAVWRLLQLFKPAYALHGACEGADRQFDALARSPQPGYTSVPHVAFIEMYPSNEEQLAWAREHRDETWDRVHPMQHPLARNRVIAARCDILVATPYEMAEVLRSGTWATVRYAREAGKQVCIVYRDGTWEGVHP